MSSRQSRAAGPERRAAPSRRRPSTGDAELDALIARASHDADTPLPAFSPFQAEITKYPPLDSEAQTALVVRYQASLELKARLAAGQVPARKRAEVSRHIRDGEDCLTYLVVSNFRLVQLIAREQATKRYPSRDRLAELLPDLIEEGNLALTEAAQKYEADRGPFFSAYAARAVRDRIRYVLSRSVPVRMSASWSRIQRIAQRTIPELADAYGRAPTTPELQQALLDKCLLWAEDKLSAEQQRWSEKRRHEAKLAKLRKQGMLGAIESIEQILSFAQGVAALDAEVGEEGGATLGDLIAHDEGDRLFDDLELDELRRALEVVLGTLSDRERMIVLYRYGFADGEPWTYERISEVYNVSSERIRQIEKSVLERLRQPGAQYAALSAFLPSQFEG